MNTEQLFTPRFAVPADKEKKTNPPKVDGLVRIYGRSPGPYELRWRERGTEGPIKRTMRADWARAKKAAEKINTALTNGQVARNQLGEAGAASAIRCEAIASRYGRSAESILMEVSEALDLLAGRANLRQAVEGYLLTLPRDAKPKPIPNLVDLHLEEKRSDGLSDGWILALANPLNRFAKQFTGPLQAISSADINSWLRSLRDAKGKPLGSRSRHNHRAAVDQLARWAQASGFLSKTWSEMDQVQDPGAKAADIRILTPDQMTRLIATRAQAEECGRAEKSLVPFLALQAFAGIRHEEMNPKMNPKKVFLDWRDIHLEERYLYVPKDVAKTGRDRTVPISDNLAAWLTPHAKRNGPVCPISSVSSALTRAKKSANIPSGENETRNVLRKSYISYRKALVKNVAQVAEEAGNSAAIIRKYYARIIPEAEAKRWFDIWPTAAAVLQLNFAGI